MIQASEIKVGNVFIRELRTSRGLEYDHDFIITEEQMGELIGDNIGLALQDLFPIPLSSEILMASGFAQSFTSDPQEPDYSQVFEINHVSIHQHSKKENKFFWYNVDLEVEIKYLHQLQNLYYSLTGTELIYKP